MNWACFPSKAKKKCKENTLRLWETKRQANANDIPEIYIFCYIWLHLTHVFSPYNNSSRLDPITPV